MRCVIISELAKGKAVLEIRQINDRYNWEIEDTGRFQRGSDNDESKSSCISTTKMDIIKISMKFEISKTASCMIVNHVTSYA